MIEVQRERERERERSSWLRFSLVLSLSPTLPVLVDTHNTQYITQTIFFPREEALISYINVCEYIVIVKLHARAGSTWS